VDDEDYDKLSLHKWCVMVGVGKNAGRTCAVRTPKKGENRGKKLIYMHREILAARPGQLVDHKNSDSLDNRKENLRLCSPLENMWHKRKHGKRFPLKGITAKRFEKYRSRIRVNGKNIELGSFATIEEAASAYDRAAINYFGEFAELNFPGVSSKSHPLQ
jgi:hypothetical protein